MDSKWSDKELWGDRASKKLLPGKYVNVYQKPVTGEDLEGVARLVEQTYFPTGPHEFPRWKVQFVADQVGDWYERLINPNNAQAHWERVDLVASGYEWTCPHCETLNREVETAQRVTCEECGLWFRVDEVFHAVR